MRVLLLGPYPPPHGGVQTNLVAIRTFLLKEGIPCSVINITRHRKPDADEVYYPRGPAQVIQLLTRLNYDLLHLHIGGMLSKRLLALCLVCARWPGKKSVMTFHSGGFPSTPEGQALGPSSFAGFVLRSFDGIIGVNGEIIEFLRRLGVRPERARLVSPYAFLGGGGAELPSALENFFASHDPVLTSVGLLEPEYDLPLQIEALTPIREKFPRGWIVNDRVRQSRVVTAEETRSQSLGTAHLAAGRCPSCIHHAGDTAIPRDASNHAVRWRRSVSPRGTAVGDTGSCDRQRDAADRSAIDTEIGFAGACDCDRIGIKNATNI